MKKAILIGNGFTSQLINEYSDSRMKENLLNFFEDEYYYLNGLFNIFRMSNIVEDDIYYYGGGLYPSEELFPSDTLYPTDDRILYNNKIRAYVLSELQQLGFQDYEQIYNTYFIEYGLIFEVIKHEIYSIENLLKVVNMFKMINKTSEDMEIKIKEIANKIYFNEGKYGLADTDLKDYSKIETFVSEYNFVFTTNYDLILDDLCKNTKEVYHLHGGFNIEHRNLKTNKRLTDKDAYIVWGINGDEKYQELSPGWDFSNFRFDAVRFGQSLLADYFSYLGDYDYEEIHIFGFSGQNDQHINKKIVENKSNKAIFFYCNPESASDYKFQCRIKELFEGTKAKIILEPWTKIWDRIKD